MKRSQVVVIGAGLTGLTCAWYLNRAGVDVLLLEASDQVGGAMRSMVEGPAGLVIEWGPQSVRSADPELFDHFRELGIEDRRIVADEGAGKRRYILWDERLHALPSDPVALLGTRLISLKGKLRLLAEPFVGPGPDPESVADFSHRRLGSEVAERLVDPFVAGVWAAVPERLDVAAALPALARAEQDYGSLTRWGLSKLWAKRRGRNGPGRKAEIFSFTEGLGTWSDALAAQLGTRILRDSPVERVDRTDGGWRVRADSVDGPLDVTTGQVVIATRADGAAGMLRDMGDGSVTRCLRGIPYAPIAQVHLVYRTSDVRHPLDGFGYLCPTATGRPALGALWTSSIFPGRVSEGLVQTVTFIGGARAPERTELPDAELIEIADAEHRRWVGATASPRVARVVRHAKAIPQYGFDHLDRVARADAFQDENPGLHLAGAWRGGPSVPDRWNEGRSLAARLVEALDESPARGVRGDASGGQPVPGLEERQSPILG